MIKKVNSMFNAKIIAVLILLVIVGAAVSLAAYEYTKPKLPRLPTQKYLFIDDALIASSKGVKLTVNQPVRDGQIILESNYSLPDDHLIMALYNTVMKDGDKIRIWYQGKWGDQFWMCYAESDDSLHFKVPDLGIVDIGEPNNIVLPLEHAPKFTEPSCVFIDEKPGVPDDEKYKACFRIEDYGVFVAYSPDGINFTVYDKPSFRDSDTGNTVFWDDRINRYVAYVREWYETENGERRAVARCEFEDLGDWSGGTVPENKREYPRTRYKVDWGETVVLTRDEIDPPDIDFYTNAAVKYEGVYLMFPSVLYHPPNEEEIRKHARNFGLMDVQLATSRDGINWTRVDRRPFLPLAESSEWDSAMLYMFKGLVINEKEIWMYYWGRNYPHSWSVDEPGKPWKASFGRLRLRLDGFVSVDAPYTGGELTTIPINVTANRLVLNIQTSAAGMAKVEILDADGKPIPSFTLQEADEIKGNFIRKTVTWNGSSDIRSLVGRPVQLHFVMRDAKLFSFQFVWE